MHRDRLPALRLLLTASAIALVTALTGCSGGSLGSGSSTAVRGTVTPGQIGGLVHGGQQPIIGSTIQLYEAGSGGDGSAAHALLSTPVVTDTNGRFDVTGKYTCTSPQSLLYLAASGGDPGIGSNNSAIEFIALLGPCGSLNTSTVVHMNEVSTVAAAMSIYDYMNGVSQVGYSGSISGITAAFADVTDYEDPSTGLPAGPDADLVTKQANVMAACVNSSGPSSQACTLIASSTGGAGTTLTSLLYMARHSTQDFSNLYNTLIVPNAPYAGSGGGGNSGGNGGSGSCTNTSTTLNVSFTVNGNAASISNPQGATIYYTKDGTMPTTSSSQWTSGTIPVELDDVLRLYATRSCYTDSYFSMPVDTPVLVEDHGSYSLTNAVTGVSYFYTTDGADPTTSSPKYTAPVSADQVAQTVQVLGKAPGLIGTIGGVWAAQSAITIDSNNKVTLADTTDTSKYGAGTITYGLNGDSSTTFTPYAGPFSVTLPDIVYACVKSPGRYQSCTMTQLSTLPVFTVANGVFTASPDATFTNQNTVLFYTLDNTVPGISSLQYSSAVTLPLTSILRLQAKAPGRPWSGTTGPNATSTKPTLTYTGTTVAVTGASGEGFYYTTDGTIPTVNSTHYSGAFTPGDADVITVIGKEPGYAASSASYSPTTANPAVTYNANGTVTLTDSDSGAKIYYTLDRTTPGVTSTKYTAPFSPGSGVLTVIAKAPGKYASSAVAPLSTPTPAFSVTGTTVTMTDADAAAVIYYTADGSTPTTSSTKYTGAFTEQPGDVYRLIAQTPGKIASSPTPVQSGTYTSTKPAITIGDGRTITITGPAGYEIVYRTDGSAPGTGDPIYSAPFTAPAFGVITAVLKKPGYAPNGATATLSVGGYITTLATCGTAVNGLAVSRTGIVYAACVEGGSTEHIYQVSSGGSLTSLFSYSLSGASDKTLGLLVTPAGTLYAPDPDGLKVHRWMFGQHTTVTTNVAVDHLFGADWEEAFALDGTGNELLIGPGVTSASTLSDGSAPHTCDGGLLDNYVYGGIYCATKTAYLGATGDTQSIPVPGYVGGLALEVDGTMLLATRSNSGTASSALYAITAKGSPKGATQSLLTRDTTPGNSSDGQQLSSYRLNDPMSVAADPAGNVYVGQADGSIKKLVYSQNPAAATPTISVNGTTATISSSTPGAVIYYTTDGSVPTRGAWAFLNTGDSSQNATDLLEVQSVQQQNNNIGQVGVTYQLSNGGSFTVPADKTIHAIAVVDSYYDSAVATH